MKVRILVGPRAGQVDHVERTKDVYKDIKLGFLEVIEEQSQPKLQPHHEHVVPPAPPLEAEWKTYKTDLSGIATLQVRLPRAEVLTFSGEVGTAAYRAFLKYCGCEPPQAVINAYQALRNQIDPLVVHEENNRRRAELEEAMRRTNVQGY